MPKHRLNLFALPNQTTLLFLTIMVVLGLPVLLSGQAFGPIPILPATILAFTVWDFLHRPERIWKRHSLEKDPLPRNHPFTQWVIQVGEESEVDRIPVLVVAHESLNVPFAFGTWRQNYLAVPPWMVRAVANGNPQDIPVLETVLRHELAHFANKDIWLTYFTRSFLKMSVLCLLAEWFALTWLPFLYTKMLSLLPDWTAFLPVLFIEQLPSDLVEFIAAPIALTSEQILVYVATVGIAIWPLIIACGIIALVEWPRLLQVRELYSDARVAAWQAAREPLREAVQRLSSIHAEHSQHIVQPRKWLHRIPLSTPQLSWPALPARWFSPQPSGLERQQALFSPAFALGSSWQIGLRAGRSVLLLHLLLASAFAPGLRGIGSEITAGFGFCLLAIGLMPLIMNSQPSWKNTWKQIIPAIVVYTLVFNGVALLFGLLILTVIPMQMANELDYLLNITFYAIALVMPQEAVSIDIHYVDYVNQIVPGGILILLVGLPFFLIVFLCVDIYLKRQVLTWYAAPFLTQRHRAIFWAITMALGILLWFGAIPILNLIAFPWIFSGDSSLLLQVGIAWSCTILMILFGYGLHRRYAQRCPDCAEHVSGPFFLGKDCPHCGEEPLNAWLRADY